MTHIYAGSPGEGAAVDEQKRRPLAPVDVGDTGIADVRVSLVPGEAVEFHQEAIGRFGRFARTKTEVNPSATTWLSVMVISAKPASWRAVP